MIKQLVSIILLLSAPAVAMAGWEFMHIAAQCLPRSPFAAFSYGPAQQTYQEIWFAEWGKNGEIYFIAKYRQGLWMIKDGLVHRIAGLDRRGYRDGPAEFALFSGSCYPPCDFGIDTKGNFYLSDGYNEAIRKVYKSDGKWYVSTFAGRGATAIASVGQTGSATSFDINAAQGLTVCANDFVWVCVSRYLMRISLDGTLAVMDYIPDASLGCTQVRDAIALSSDAFGNIYGIGPIAGAVFKYTPGEKPGRGAFTQLTCGNRDSSGGFDGPISTASTRSDSTLAVTPDGSIIYFGGDDENGTLRKIEDEGGGLRVKSLLANGKWSELESHWDIVRKKPQMLCGAPVLLDPEGGIYLTHTQFTRETTRFRRLIHK